MGLRYIGSKARVVDEILDLLGTPSGDAHTLVDGFCGTGAVAVAAAALGWNVGLNDALYSAVVMAAARLVTPDDVPFAAFGGYAATIERLNKTPGFPGFIAREYSPLSVGLTGLERRYFTVDNAAKIDARRARIRAWWDDGRLTTSEHHLLLGDLMLAANRVANTAGTYGCFLSAWSSVSLQAMALQPRDLANHEVQVTATVGDVLAVPCCPTDVAYFDPPYTKRQYAAYYHILETIAAGDEPVVEGVTGLRPWKHLASDYCYRSRALGALDQLVAYCPASRVLLSYSSEGHVPREALEAALAGHGDVRVHQIGGIGRYRPNRAAATRGGNSVQEYVFEVTRATMPAVAAEAAA